MTFRSKISLLLAAIASSAMVAAAAQPSGVRATNVPFGSPTHLSYTWNFPKETSGLFVQLNQDAVTVRDLADKFNMYNENPDLFGWQPYANTLNEVKDQVNQMDRIMYRLRETKRVDSPRQQRAINRIAPAVLELDLYTAQAMDYLNHNQVFLWNPVFRSDTSAVYTRAIAINRDLRQVMASTKLGSAAHPGPASASAHKISGS